MKTYDNVKMEWGREGLSINQDGKKIAVVDCCELARLHIGYGDNLDETPAGWFCTRKERIIKWLAQNQKGGYADKGQAEISSPSVI